MLRDKLCCFEQMNVGELVSIFLTAHQHIKGHLTINKNDIQRLKR